MAFSVVIDCAPIDFEMAEVVGEEQLGAGQLEAAEIRPRPSVSAEDPGIPGHQLIEQTGVDELVDRSPLRRPRRLLLRHGHVTTSRDGGAHPHKPPLRRGSLP